jgi:Fur family ferric uptake transcriptional regulator
MTRQRLMVLRAVRELGCHPTADDVYDEVRKEIPRISLGTVYRNLDVLARGGLIQKIHTEEGQTRFDGNPSRHYHIRCLRCGTVEDVFAGPFPEVEEAAATATGYEVTFYRLEFAGLCPACREHLTEPQA